VKFCISIYNAAKRLTKV